MVKSVFKRIDKIVGKAENADFFQVVKFAIHEATPVFGNPED